MEKTDQYMLPDSSPLEEGAAVKAVRNSSDSYGGVAADEISLKELILKMQEWGQYFLSKWLIIVIAGIIGGGLGLMYAYSKKTLYNAELSFVLEDSQSGGGLGAYSGLASIVGLDVGNSTSGIFAGDNLIEFMKSRSMIEKTLLTSVNMAGKTQSLADFYIDIHNLRKGWETDPKLKDMHFPPTANRAPFPREKDSVLTGIYRSLVAGSLSVSKLDKKLSIITVIVKTPDELFSKYFTETLVGVVSDFYVETRTKKAAENLLILERQTDSVRRALNSAISGVAISADINPNPNMSRRVLQVPSQRRQVDVQANQAILTELVKNLEVAKVSLRKETPLIQIIDRPILPLEKERFGRLKGLILGGFIGGAIAVMILVFSRFRKEIMA